MRTENNIPAFVISLPKDKERREHLETQLRKLSIPYAITEAVYGKALSAEELAASYDPEKAIWRFNRELSKGEIGCALSHMNIYRKMVAEDIPHALVLEDDANLLDDQLPATLSNLARHYPASLPVAVLLSHAKRYDENTEDRLDNQHRLYEAYRGVCAHGYFITKAAAQMMVEKLFPIYVVADKWEYFQEEFFPVKVLVPYSIGLTSASLASNIGESSDRIKELSEMRGRNYMYYVRKYFKRIGYLFRSRPFVKIKYQEKLQSDMH